MVANCCWQSLTGTDLELSDAQRAVAHSTLASHDTDPVPTAPRTTRHRDGVERCGCAAGRAGPAHRQEARPQTGRHAAAPHRPDPPPRLPRRVGGEAVRRRRANDCSAGAVTRADRSDGDRRAISVGIRASIDMAGSRSTRYDSEHHREFEVQALAADDIADRDTQRHVSEVVAVDRRRHLRLQHRGIAALPRRRTAVDGDFSCYRVSRLIEASSSCCDKRRPAAYSKHRSNMVCKLAITVPIVRRTNRHRRRALRHGRGAGGAGSAPRQDPRPQAGDDAGAAHRQDAARSSRRRPCLSNPAPSARRRTASSPCSPTGASRQPRLPLSRRLEQAGEQPLHRDGAAARQPDGARLLRRAHLRRPAEAGDRRRRDRHHALPGQPAHLPAAALRRAGADRGGQAHETVHLIDWEHPEKNDFALAEEVTLQRRLRAAARHRALPQRHRHRGDRAEAQLGGDRRRHPPAHHQPGGDFQQGLLQHGAARLRGQRLAGAALRHHRHAGEVLRGVEGRGADRRARLPPARCSTGRSPRCATRPGCST